MTDSRLDRLLERWQTLRQEGRSVTPEELCRDCPELVDELRQRLAEAHTVEVTPAEAVGTVDDHGTVRPEWSAAAPPPAISLEDFISRLERSGMLAATEVQTLLTNLPPGQRPSDGLTLTTLLLRQNKLNPFQARVLQDGSMTRLVLGEYIIVDRIGAGGMGQVFQARHRRMDRIVALKMLPKEVVSSPDAVQRFQREVQAAAKLISPNIVTAYDAGEQDGCPFLVMEYVQGRDLHQLVKESGALAIDQAVDCIRQAARGLEYAHAQGIVHRDIKPANLLRDVHGTIKILDMGLARFQANEPADGSHLTQAGAVMGTPDYLAPEQSLDAAAADQRADIYALGCTLCYLLTGKPIFDGNTIMKKIVAHREAPIPSLRALRSEVPAPLDAVFRKMVAKKPEERYQSMTDVLAHLPMPATQVVLPDRPRRRWLWAAGIAGLLLIGLVLYRAAATVKVPVARVGTLVVEVDEPDTLIEVDGKKVTIARRDGSGPIVVEVEEGKHDLKVTKNGFEAFTREFRVKAGNKDVIKVRLEPAGATTPAVRGNLFALSVGYDVNVKKKKKVDSYAADAAAIDQVLRDKTASVFDRVQAKLLTGPATDRAAVLDGFKWLQGAMTDKDVAMIFVCMNGEPDGEGGLCLLGADAKGAAWMKTAVSTRDLKAELARIPGRIIFMLDSNSAGVLSKTLNANPNLVFIGSTREGEGSSGDDEHWFLARTLLDGLGGKADANGDGFVDLGELTGYVTKRMSELTGDNQHAVIVQPKGMPATVLTKP